MKNDLIGRNTNFEMSPAQIPETLISQLAGSMTDNTRRAYMNDIQQFFNINNFKQLTVDMIRDVDVSSSNKYFMTLKDQGYANSTINRKLQALTKFYKFLCRREVGVMDYNPFSADEGSARLKVKKYSNTRSLTDDEVKTFMEVISEDKTIIGLRNKIILLLLATTGMRRTEIADLTIGQITKNMGSHVVEFEGKGNKERFVVIAEPIKVLIDRYLGIRELTYMDKSKPLFTSHSSNSKEDKCITSEVIYQLIKKIAKQANLDADSISPHCFRHTYITKSIQLGCDIIDIQDRVGHADLGTTRRYDHTLRIIENNPADNLAKIYGGLI